MLKKGFLYFGLAFFGFSVLTSCEKCKDCNFTTTVQYYNIPTLSGITNKDFSKIDYFKKATSNMDLNELCGDNLDKYDNLTETDTVYIDDYINNSGAVIQVPGGITRLTTNKYDCK